MGTDRRGKIPNPKVIKPKSGGLAVAFVYDRSVDEASARGERSGNRRDVLRRRVWAVGFVAILYVLSVGRAEKLRLSMHGGELGIELVRFIYAPLEFIADRSDPVGAVLTAYVHFWTGDPRGAD
jgi:hypothetical protein